MAWRLDEAVVRGEIDNRIRDRVTGRIWFAGRAEPVVLDLAGNPWRDLAGRRLDFVNPAPRPDPQAARLAARQTGTTGDITASRKVKVPDIPLGQIGDYVDAGKPFPWHWGNALYLEWFGETDGRVVIETASFQLTVSPDATWDMTAEEEAEQRKANAAGLGDFVAAAGAALAAADDPEDDPARPQTEAEADRQQAESDKLMDRIMARMDREGDDADYDKILTEELERARRERGEPDPTPEQEAERARWIDEMNAAAAEAVEAAAADDWKRADGGSGADDWLDDQHPVAARAFEFSVRVMKDTDEKGWIGDDAPREHPLVVLVASVSGAGAKLAGALNGDDWPPPLEFCAGKIVRLKKAANYWDDAALAVESCRAEALADPAWLEGVARELADLTRDTDALIAELRARLE